VRLRLSCALDRGSRYTSQNLPMFDSLSRYQTDLHLRRMDFVYPYSFSIAWPRERHARSHALNRSLHATCDFAKASISATKRKANGLWNNHTTSTKSNFYCIHFIDQENACRWLRCCVQRHIPSALSLPRQRGVIRLVIAENTNS